MRPEDRVLDRLAPPDWEHVEKYGLTAAVPPTGTSTILGINWYTEFDYPEKDSNGRWWVAKDSKLTTIRGGHCVATKSDFSDSLAWWAYYNQGQEGSCVGFGSSRCMTLRNRYRYNAHELYLASQIHGDYLGKEGAYVRDAGWVLKNRGPMRSGEQKPRLEDGISAYYWATDVTQVIVALDMPMAAHLGAVPFLNSWGKDYPHITWMPGEVLERLLQEDGEIMMVTDR